MHPHYEVLPQISTNQILFDRYLIPVQLLSSVQNVRSFLFSKRVLSMNVFLFCLDDKPKARKDDENAEEPVPGKTTVC